MKRRWNLLAPAGFLVTLLAFFSYFMFFALFPLTRDFPWLNLLLFLLGGLLLGIGLQRSFGQPERYLGKVSGVILSTLSVLVFGLFLFYCFRLSRMLPASRNAPAVSQKAPDFTLPDSHGKPVTLSGLRAPAPGAPSGQWVLLIFYRGYW